MFEATVTAIFGADKRHQRRLLYATNFAVLLSTFVSGYIYDRSEIAGVYGFSGAKYLKSWASLVPMANLLAPLMQQVVGFGNVTKCIPACMLLHAAILVAQAVLQIFGTDSCHFWWMLTFPIINLNYGIIDHWLDQVELEEDVKSNNAGEFHDESFDQAYRGVGVVLINWPVALVLLLVPEGSPRSAVLFAMQCIILPALICTVVNSLHGKAKLIQTGSTSGGTKARVGIPFVLWLVVIVFINAFPDGVLDAFAKMILTSTSKSVLLPIRLGFQGLGWLLTHPAIFQAATSSTSSTSKPVPRAAGAVLPSSRRTATAIAVTALLLRLVLLYSWTPGQGLPLVGLGESVGFGLQVALDIVGMVVLKNMNEAESRGLAFQSQEQSNWSVPAPLANFVQEQASPFLKQQISFRFLRQQLALDKQVWFGLAAVSVFSSVGVTAWSQARMRSIVSLSRARSQGAPQKKAA
jgi:hypothetical protein